jgi:hypothetical protein
MSQPQREEAIELLKDETGFCWECFMIRPNPSTCQCWNDE